MRSLFLLGVYLAIVGLGFAAPFVFVLGYVWVDIFTPQHVAFSLLNRMPVSLILGLLVALSLFRLPRDPFVRVRPTTVLTVVFGLWMTLTLLWAEVPQAALQKWDWAFKSVMFSVLIPFFIRTREQFEALLWTIVLAGIAHCIPFGLKVLISGGGYGRPLGLVQYNAGLGEGSTLAMFSIAMIPMCLYLYKWQTLLPWARGVRLMLIGFIALAVLTSMGTYARTGLVSIVTLGALLIMRSRHKAMYLVGVALAAGLLALLVSDTWLTRMASIDDTSEQSAMGRVAVWLWTLEYVAQNPWGGSFEAYRINRNLLELGDGSVLAVEGKAFHSIYFETLGETGVPGFLMFMGLVWLARSGFVKARKARLTADNGWINDAGRYLLFSLYVFLAGGAFIGIAFQSLFYYLAAISMALVNLCDRHRPT